MLRLEKGWLYFTYKLEKEVRIDLDRRAAELPRELFPKKTLSNQVFFILWAKALKEIVVPSLMATLLSLQRTLQL